MIPPLVPVRQHCPDDRIADVEAATIAALEQLAVRERIRPGMRVAITAGSRGIRNIDQILRTAVAYLRAVGATPLLVAAMGSHGGGTAAGQLDVLDSLGITAAKMECDVVGGVDVVNLGQTAQGLTVYFDKVAAGCDAVLVINRVKAHTSFHGSLESGLVKMLVVGLGKPAGAAQFHSLGAARLSGALAEIGRVILERAPILGGIAVLENGREETAALVPVRPHELIDREQELLVQAKALLPRLPVRELDLLIVEEMGKNISGTGMDTNVIGRMGICGVPDGEPSISRIVVLDLSAGSHGNANGMGLADIITERFRQKIDFAATYMNTLTATFVRRAAMPIVQNSDRDAIATAIRTLGTPPPDKVRAIRIRNTLCLEHLWVSPAVAAELGERPNLHVIGQPEPLQFDATGALVRDSR